MKRWILLIGLLFLVLFSSPAVSALAVTVDGNLDDWGLNALAGPSSDWSMDQTWVPTQQAVAFLVEDNDNPMNAGLPGFYAPGVHITGNMNNWVFYDENSGILRSSGQEVNVPWGGEPYDVEAMYIAQDTDNIYVAVITSMPQDGLFGPSSGHDDTPSDLAMHFSNVNGVGAFNFEYGVKLGTQTSPGNYMPGEVVFLPDWQSYGYILPAKPDVMKSPALPGGGVVGQAQIAYTDSWINHPDNGYPNYVIELGIPKTAIGMSSGTTPIALNSFLITQNCLNDDIYVPEFPTFAVSVGAILGIVFVIYIVREKKE